MQIKDLEPQEQLALVGLLRLMIKADEELSDDENTRVVAVRNQLGNEAFQTMAKLARQHVRGREHMAASMAEVKRPAARRAIVDELQRLGEADGLVQSEAELLDWVRSAWELS